MTDAPQRLDQVLAARGLARSRTHAARLVDLGVVRVNGLPATRAARKIGPDDTVTVDRADHYVSRAAHKLIAALDAFDIDPTGRDCLDVGASTGGFTQVLLERAARHVVALDVGHGQLEGGLALNPAVTLLEGVNARDLTRATLDTLLGSETQRAGTGRPAASGITLAVADLSFISLGHVLGPMRETVADDADFALLIKPQFEVGRTGVREGIVTDPTLARDAVERVVWQAFDVGLGTLGLIASPIAGTHGNREYVAHFAARGAHPTQWTDSIRDLTKGART